MQPPLARRLQQTGFHAARMLRRRTSTTPEATKTVFHCHLASLLRNTRPAPTFHAQCPNHSHRTTNSTSRSPTPHTFRKCVMLLPIAYTAGTRDLQSRKRDTAPPERIPAPSRSRNTTPSPSAPPFPHVLMTCSGAPSRVKRRLGRPTAPKSRACADSRFFPISLPYRDSEPKFNAPKRWYILIFLQPPQTSHSREHASLRPSL